MKITDSHDSPATKKNENLFLPSRITRYPLRFTYKYLTVIFFIVLLIFYDNLSASTTSDKLLEQAKDLIISGSTQEAIKKIKESLKMDSKNPYAYFLLGNAYYGQGDYEESINNYKNAITLKSDYGEACYNLGTIYYNKKDINNSIKYLEKAKNSFKNQKISEKYEKTLKKLIEISGGNNLASYRAELKQYQTYGFGPVPTPTVTPTPAPTFTPTCTPEPTCTPTITPTPTPVGIFLKTLPVINVKNITPPKSQPFTLTIDRKDFRGLLVKEGEIVFAGVLDLFSYINYDGYYEPPSRNIIIEGEIIPKDWLRIDNKNNLYISLIDFCKYFNFSYTLNNLNGEYTINIRTTYQESALHDFLSLSKSKPSKKLEKSNPAISVGGKNDGGTFRMFDDYFRLNLSDRTEYRLDLSRKEVFRDKTLSGNCKLFEQMRQEFSEPYVVKYSEYSFATFVTVTTCRTFIITFYDSTKATIRIKSIFTTFEEMEKKPQNTNQPVWN